MKKIIALILSACLSVSLVACSSTQSQEETTERTPVTIRLLVDSRYETDANVISDQLKKAGFEVDTTISPSLSDRISAAAAGEFDLEYSGWSSGTANPDYAASNLYTSTSNVNHGELSDPHVDELVALAATQTYDEYVNTYAELEKYLVEEMVYTIPLYQTMNLHVFHNTIVDEESITVPVAATQYWSTYDYVDESLRDTRTLTMGYNNGGVITHLDPIQVSDTSVAGTTFHGNIRVMSLGLDDNVTTENSLSLSYAIAEGNTEYYFLLRDDIFFAKTENGVAVNTEVRVGAEDAAFSILRATDITSVPTNKVSATFSYISDAQVVEDITELETTMDSTTGESVLNTLMQGIDNEITEISSDKTLVDNQNGNYQVLKVTTKEPYPQILNVLTHTAASVLSKEQVENMNGDIDMEQYDRTSDVIYGDVNAVKTGDNHLWSSGAYAVTNVDDYGATFMRNPGYMTSEENPVLIENIEMKFFKDNESMLSAFRSGEIDYLSSFDTSKIEILEEDENLTVVKNSASRVEFLTVNMRENSNLLDQDLRLAVLYALDQNVFVDVKNGLVATAYSPMSTFIGEPNAVIEQDLEKSKLHLDAYYAKQEQ